MKGGDHWMEIHTYDASTSRRVARRTRRRMIVRLRQPKREVEMPGARTVNQLLDSSG